MTCYLKHVTTFLCLCLLLPLCSPVHAGDDRLRDVLLDAASLSRADVERARSRQTLGLFDLYALSVATTERMAIRGEEGEQARARHDQAFGAFLPQLSLRAYKTLPEPGGGSSFAPRTTVGVYARQNLLTGLDEYSNYRGTRAELRMRACLLKKEASLLLYDVAAAYLNVLRVDKDLRSKHVIRDNYRAIAAEIEKRVRLGRTRRGELLVIRSREYSLDAEIESLENDSRRAMGFLRTLTGLDRDVPLQDNPVIAAPSYMDAEPAALTANRYDIKALAEEVEIAQAGILRAGGGHLPSVYLDGGWRLYQKSMQGQDYYLGLGATVPLFSGGITMAQVDQARSARRQASLALDQGRRFAQREIADAMTSYRGSGREVEYYARALDMARSSYEAAAADYRLSLVTLLDVLNALTDLQNAQSALDRVMLEQVLDRVALGVVSGEFTAQGMDVLRNAAGERAQ